jgi:hypothetical protein
VSTDFRSFLGTLAPEGVPFSRDKTFLPGLPRHPPNPKAESIEAADHTLRRWICKAEMPLPVRRREWCEAEGRFYGSGAVMATPSPQNLHQIAMGSPRNPPRGAAIMACCRSDLTLQSSGPGMIDGGHFQPPGSARHGAPL